MSEKFIRAEEVAEVMKISVAYAYKIIRKWTIVNKVDRKKHTKS